jgi:hypothetical protein
MLPRFAWVAADEVEFDAVATAAVFHLPGLHDQKSHGNKHTGGTLHDEDAWNSVKVADNTSGMRLFTQGVGIPHPVDFHEINGQLRKTGNKLDDVQRRRVAAAAADMDTQFAAATPLTRSIFVHRGIRNADEFIGPPGSRTGQRFQDLGFNSTTTDVDVAESFADDEGDARIDIVVPVGARALRIPAPPGMERWTPPYDLDTIAVHGTPEQFNWVTEREILLNRGATYEVKRDYETDYGQRVIEVELII